MDKEPSAESASHARGEYFTKKHPNVHDTRCQRSADYLPSFLGLKPQAVMMRALGAENPRGSNTLF